MCNNLCYLVVVFQEIYFTILIVLFAGAVVIVRNQKILIYLHCQPSYYFYYCKQDDIENENEIICLISNKQDEVEAVTLEVNRDKISFFLTVTESLVLSNESSRTLLSFHPVQCKMNYTSCCGFDLCECVRHAVSPRHIYFKISDNKKRETGGNHFDIVPTSPVLNLLEL